MKRKNIYNNFKTPELWKKVNKHNKMLIEDYKLQLRSVNKSKGTINQYINDLGIFACYIASKLDNKKFFNVSTKDIRNFVLFLQDKEMSSSRINRMLSSIRTMYDFAINEEDYEENYIKNPASKTKGLKKEKVREIEFLTRAEIDIIYNDLIKREEYQQALLLALLIDSAGRKNEVYQVLKSGIKEDDNFTNKVKGKGGKEFTLMYNDLTKETFKLYLEQRGNDKLDFLWYRVSNGNIVELEVTTLYNWVKSWNKILLKETGEERNINIHTFRHTALELYSTGEHYLCEKLNYGCFSLDQLQALANHNDISTTNSYLKVKTEDILRNAFVLGVK